MPELELVPSLQILLTETQTTVCTELVQYKKMVTVLELHDP